MYLLFIFAIVLTVLYPYALKLVRYFLKLLIFESITSTSSSESRSWALVIYKFTSYFIFDSRIGSSCGGNLLSSTSRTGFWASLNKEVQERNVTDFLEDLLNNKRIQVAVWNSSLASSSLALSYSSICHMLCIYIMMQKDIFQRLTCIWISNNTVERRICVLIVTACIAINTSRYFFCVNFTNEWIH